MTEAENKQLMKRCTTRDKKTGNELFDRSKHAHELAALAVVYPDLTDAELQKGYSVLGAAELLEKMLYIGEFATLSEAVTELSGLDKDINEDIESVKNA